MILNPDVLSVGSLLVNDTSTCRATNDTQQRLLTRQPAVEGAHCRPAYSTTTQQVACGLKKSTRLITYLDGSATADTNSGSLPMTNNEPTKPNTITITSSTMTSNGVSCGGESVCNASRFRSAENIQRVTVRGCHAGAQCVRHTMDAPRRSKPGPSRNHDHDPAPPTRTATGPRDHYARD